MDSGKKIRKDLIDKYFEEHPVEKETERLVELCTGGEGAVQVTKKSKPEYTITESLVIPNFIREYSKNYICLVANVFRPYPTPEGRFGRPYEYECDLLAINKKRMVSEFEIKLSVADFRKDFEKRLVIYKRPSLYEPDPQSITKYDLLFTGQLSNYFSYVMPYDVYEAVKDEVPKKFGVVSFDPELRYNKWMQVAWRKVPRRLHDRECADQLLIDMMRKMQQRYEGVMFNVLNKKLKQKQRKEILYNESSMGAEE